MRKTLSDVETRLLRLAETAQYLGVSLSTVYQLVRRGDLRPITLPGLRGSRFDRTELDILVEQSRQANRGPVTPTDQTPR